jgi:hypothetical protein
MNLQRAWDDFCYELKLEARQTLNALMNFNTWIVIFALIAFGVEIFFGMGIAMRYDTLMRYDSLFQIWGGNTRCRILSNRQYLTVIFSLFAFVIAMAYCLGRIMNYLSARKRKVPDAVIRSHGFWAAISFIATEALGGVAIGLLMIWC